MIEDFEGEIRIIQIPLFLILQFTMQKDARTQFSKSENTHCRLFWIWLSC